MAKINGRTYGKSIKNKTNKYVIEKYLRNKK